jgi:hypothetical protein
MIAKHFQAALASKFLLALEAAGALVPNPLHRRTLPVLDLDPMPGPAALIGAIAMFRHQALKPHVAGRAE